MGLSINLSTETDMVDPTTLFEASTALAETVSKLGILEAVKKKLASQPDVAATKLAGALAELQKTFLAFDAEVVPYLAIYLERGEERQDLTETVRYELKRQYRKDVNLLYSLEGGAALVRASAARGHCGRIGNIYDVYLNPWFKKVVHLNESERAALKDLFDRLRFGDNEIVLLIERSAMWLGNSAREVLDHVENGDLNLANDTIASARKQILPVRKSLSDALNRIRKLEADFIEISGVV